MTNFCMNCFRVFEESEVVMKEHKKGDEKNTKDVVLIKTCPNCGSDKIVNKQKAERLGMLR